MSRTFPQLHQQITSSSDFIKAKRDAATFKTTAISQNSKEYQDYDNNFIVSKEGNGCLISARSYKDYLSISKGKHYINPILSGASAGKYQSWMGAFLTFNQRDASNSAPAVQELSYNNGRTYLNLSGENKLPFPPTTIEDDPSDRSLSSYPGYVEDPKLQFFYEKCKSTDNDLPRYITNFSELKPRERASNEYWRAVAGQSMTGFSYPNKPNLSIQLTNLDNAHYAPIASINDLTNAEEQRKTYCGGDDDLYLRTVPPSAKKVFELSDLNIKSSDIIYSTPPVENALISVTWKTARTCLEDGTTHGENSLFDQNVRNGTIKSWYFQPDSSVIGSTPNDDDLGNLYLFNKQLYTNPRVLASTQGNSVETTNGWAFTSSGSNDNYSLVGENPWQPILDAKNLSYNSGTGSKNNWQSFTIECIKGYISKVEWEISGTTGVAGNTMTLSLYEGDANSLGPTGTFLAKKENLLPSPTESAIVFRGFDVINETSKLVEVTQGEKYTMELELVTDNTAGFLHFANNNPYSGGQGYPVDGGGGGDYKFRTYVLVKLS